MIALGSAQTLMHARAKMLIWSMPHNTALRMLVTESIWTVLSASTVKCMLRLCQRAFAMPSALYPHWLIAQQACKVIPQAALQQALLDRQCWH